MKRTIEKIKGNKGLNVLFMGIKAVTSLIIILIVSIIFVQRISNNKITLGGYSIFTVVTGSMVPVYEVGDMILTLDVDPDTLEVGDDVVYMGEMDSYKDKIVTHRIVSIDNSDGTRVFHTKGVANSYEDPLVNGNQIYGKVLYRFTILSFLSKIVNNAYGFYFIVFIPFAVMIFMEVMDVIHDREKIKR